MNKNIFWLIVIGLMYYFNVIQGLYAIIMVVVVFLVNAFQKQEEKIEELSDKIEKFIPNDVIDDLDN